MTSDDILPVIKNAAATYTLVGKFKVDFSGSGDCFSEFDNATALCLYCEAEADYYSLGIYGPTGRPIAHMPECPCSKDAVLAAEFAQQALDVLTYEEVKRKDSSIATRNRWIVKEDVLFKIMDFDGRTDFNNDGSTGSITIDFKNLKIEIEVSVNEMVSTDLGASSYDSSDFDPESSGEPKEVTPSKVDKVDIDALGDFKEWLGPAN